MSVEVINFGCRLNMAEGATLARDLTSEDDLIIVNSCAVTAEAARQARQAIRRAARLRPDARIVVTGCAAQTEAARFAAMPEVARVVGAAEKRAVASYLAQPGTPAFATITPAVSGPDQARAFVEVQNGCDHDCTFCVTTVARGPARSLDMGAIVAAVAAAVARGHDEVVLTAVDLTSYRPSLATLVRTILDSVPALPRLRLSSIDPGEVDDALFELFAHEPRVMPHLHLSLQSGSDMILKRMKRRHRAAQAVALVERLRQARPGVAIGADLIAGFPTEDEAMAADSFAIVAACRIVHAHVFPYSPRPGTAAARMPQLPSAVARARAAVLRATAATQKAAWLGTLVGTTQRVLVERNGRLGHAENFAGVALGHDATPGAIVDVTITGATATGLLGDAA